MSEEKICIDCIVSKPIEKFGKRSKVCYTCMHIRRNKGYDKICKLCNKKKDDKDYIVTLSMCKECNEKRNLEDKVCKVCKILKTSNEFNASTNTCKKCIYIKKVGNKNKTCCVCNETKLISQFSPSPNLCKECLLKEKSQDERICQICNISKPKNKFDQKDMCRECRYIKRTNGKSKICKVCGETKAINKFMKMLDLCKDCGSSEKFENNKLCKKCEEIKPKSEFYGASWVCKPCAKQKFQEKIAELKKCEGCLLEKENKFFREMSSKRCLDCEDISITKKCRDCNETKSIAEFNPKRAQCHECEKADGRLYRKTTTKAKEWIEKNPEKMAELQRNNYEKNKKEIRQIEYKRQKEDEDFREIKNCKKNVSDFIRTNRKTSKKLLVTRDKYVCWLEYNFKDGMTMDNYGEKWCIDHVIPLGSLYKSSSQSCSGFVRKHPNHKKLLACWYNTTPTTQKENRLKSDKFDKNELRKHIVNIKSFFKQNRNIKKDDLYFEYKKFITDILEFLF